MLPYDTQRRKRRRNTQLTCDPNSPRYTCASSTTRNLRCRNTRCHVAWLGRTVTCSMSGLVKMMLALCLTSSRSRMPVGQQRASAFNRNEAGRRGYIMVSRRLYVDDCSCTQQWEKRAAYCRGKAGGTANVGVRTRAQLSQGKHPPKYWYKHLGVHLCNPVPVSPSSDAHATSSPKYPQPGVCSRQRNSDRNQYSTKTVNNTADDRIANLISPK